MKRPAEELAACTGLWETVVQAIVLQYKVQVQLGARALKQPNKQALVCSRTSLVDV